MAEAAFECESRVGNCSALSRRREESGVIPLTPTAAGTAFLAGASPDFSQSVRTRAGAPSFKFRPFDEMTPGGLFSPHGFLTRGKPEASEGSRVLRRRS